jgi:hypothetical protein
MCRVSPRQARYFLAARQESTQRSAPRLPGPASCPRCERPAGPVAKLAGQKAAGVGQRDRTTPGEPSSLGGSEGNENRRAWGSVPRINSNCPYSLTPIDRGIAVRDTRRRVLEIAIFSDSAAHFSCQPLFAISPNGTCSSATSAVAVVLNWGFRTIHSGSMIFPSFSASQVTNSFIRITVTRQEMASTGFQTTRKGSPVLFFLCRKGAE